MSIIIDTDIQTWTAISETALDRVRRCHPSEEAYYKKLHKTAWDVLIALRAHKEALDAPRPTKVEMAWTTLNGPMNKVLQYAQPGQKVDVLQLLCDTAALAGAQPVLGYWYNHIECRYEGQTHSQHGTVMVFIRGLPGPKE